MAMIAFAASSPANHIRSRRVVIPGDRTSAHGRLQAHPNYRISRVAGRKCRPLTCSTHGNELGQITSQTYGEDGVPTDRDLDQTHAPPAAKVSKIRQDESTDTDSEAAGSTVLVNSKPLDARVLLGEFLSTFLFVYVSVTNAATGVAPSAAGATNGAVIAAVAASFMPVSGAHLNPAVTVAVALAKRMPVLRAVVFIPLQLFASVCATFAAATAGVSISDTFRGISPDAGASQLFQAACAEFVPMFFIVCILFQTAVASEEEGGVGLRLAALYIGLAVFACASTFSGIFNPARAFGPAFFLSVWANHWIYWIPLLAAVLAALMCEHLFIAPSGNREPITWLADFWKRSDKLSSRLKGLGAGALAAYGFMNVVYYLPVFTIVWLRVRLLDTHSQAVAISDKYYAFSSS